MIRTLLVASTLVLSSGSAMAAFPFCHTPPPGGPYVQIGSGIKSETEKAAYYEMLLRQQGIDARDTRLWSECIQTFVRENGRLTMRFYDPFSLEEIVID